MKKRNLLKSVTLAIALVAGLTACSGGSNGLNKSGKEGENLLETVKRKVRLELEQKAHMPYLSIKMKLTGFDVEIAEEVAKRLGVKS